MSETPDGFMHCHVCGRNHSFPVLKCDHCGNTSPYDGGPYEDEEDEIHVTTMTREQRQELVRILRAGGDTFEHLAALTDRD
jgi:hypothetical protein